MSDGPSFHGPEHERDLDYLDVTPSRGAAEAQMLNSVWLEADAMDVGFAAHVSYLAESLTIVHDFDLSIGHVPTQRFTDDWLDYIVDRLRLPHPSAPARLGLSRRSVAASTDRAGGRR